MICLLILVNSSEILIISACANQYWTGVYCNISNRPCDIINPCENNGSCLNSNTTIDEYFCECPEGFDGSECQNDRRLCKPNICLNNGIFSLKYMIGMKASNEIMIDSV